jgi:hypothetical protein
MKKIFLYLPTSNLAKALAKFFALLNNCYIEKEKEIKKNFPSSGVSLHLLLPEVS